MGRVSPCGDLQVLRRPGFLAALITFYGFLSLFPLLLLLASVLGFLLEDNSELKDRVLDSALSQFPVIGDQLSDPKGLQGSGTALIIAGLIALYGALGVAQALAANEVGTNSREFVVDEDI